MALSAVHQNGELARAGTIAPRQFIVKHVQMPEGVNVSAIPPRLSASSVDMAQLRVHSHAANGFAASIVTAGGRPVRNGDFVVQQQVGEHTRSVTVRVRPEAKFDVPGLCSVTLPAFLYDQHTVLQARIKNVLQSYSEEPHAMLGMADAVAARTAAAMTTAAAPNYAHATSERSLRAQPGAGLVYLSCQAEE